MISNKNRQLLNNVLTGLVIAAFFSMLASDVVAANFNKAIEQAQNSVASPFATAVTYISYVMGATMLVAGVSKIRRHAEEPNSHPLNAGIGRVGAGAAFLAAPYVAGMLLSTSNATVGEEEAAFKAITLGN